MHRFVIVLTVLGLLLLGSCTAGETVMIENSNGRRVGEIRIQGTQSAIIVNSYGEERGRVRGNVIRDADGKRVGSFVEKDGPASPAGGNVVILDGTENAVGTVENGTDCYGKGQELLGKINATVDASVAAGACLLMFLQ